MSSQIPTSVSRPVLCQRFEGRCDKPAAYHSIVWGPNVFSRALALCEEHFEPYMKANAESKFGLWWVQVK